MNYMEKWKIGRDLADMVDDMDRICQFTGYQDVFITIYMDNKV